MLTENIHTHPKDGDNGNSKGKGRLKGQNFLKKGMKLNWNFQRGGSIQTNVTSSGVEWIFSGITQQTKSILGVFFIER